MPRSPLSRRWRTALHVALGLYAFAWLVLLPYARVYVVWWEWPSPPRTYGNVFVAAVLVVAVLTRWRAVVVAALVLTTLMATARVAHGYRLWTMHRLQDVASQACADVQPTRRYYDERATRRAHELAFGPTADEPDLFVACHGEEGWLMANLGSESVPVFDAEGRLQTD
jgi:hypothetical protein